VIFHRVKISISANENFTTSLLCLPLLPLCPLSSIPLSLFLPSSPQILLGGEDLEQIYNLGIRIAEEVMPIVSKASTPPASSAPPIPPTEGPDPPTNPSIVTTALKEEEEEEEEGYERIRMMSTLPKFELKLFRGEPHLAVDDGKSRDLSQCGAFSLASLELVSMVLNMHLSSRTEVEVQATMKDIALINGLEEAKKRNTG
jgi:hypothetical protein